MPKVLVEARVKKGLDRNEVRQHRQALLSYLNSKSPVRNWRPIHLECPQLSSMLEYVLIGADTIESDIDIHIAHDDHVVFYSSKDYEPCISEITLDEAGESAVSSTQWELPCLEFEKVWENLFYEDNIKGEILRFATSIIKLGEFNVDRDVIDINRLFLLHGPPGTGKTSLCKGLAQRIATRFQGRFRRSIFIEVNSHSLFSKWFSESGKLVQKLFDQIVELAEEPKTLVIVLVDEVESLVMKREGNTSDPTDSIRAVNAVLTQIDRIRRYPNVLVLTTSNITSKLDPAFLDRTDFCRFIGNPSKKAASHILIKAVKELARVNAIQGDLTDLSDRVENILPSNPDLSGRTLKKIPILAYSNVQNHDSIDVDYYLKLLQKNIELIK